MSNFDELGLSEPILRAITAMGFTAPTPIQEKAIPIFLKKETDLVALAQTGTGKTAAFGLPIIQQIRVEEKAIQALIISPTRELCLQITNDLKNFSKELRQIKIVPVYGGSSISTQIKDIKQGAHIVVATPGRLMDLMDRRVVNFSKLETVVLDEADEMLNMGFQEDIETILSATPEDKFVGLFSATMPKEIRSIANRYLKNPVEVSSGKKNATAQDITHQYAVVHAKDKLAAVKRIIDFNQDFFGIIFCTTKIETQDISDALMKDGYNADCLHGDLSQQQRDKVMGKFRKRVIKILCATDVAARGIDVNDITHVIHYHLPDDIENYTHRSGRTARAGKKGISIALLHIREAYKLHQIEKLANMKFEKFLIPKSGDILSKRINSFVEDFLNTEAQEEIEIQESWRSSLMELSKEELIDKLLIQKLSAWKRYETTEEDLNVVEGQRSKKSGMKDSGGDDHTRMFINLGKKDGIRYDEMREIIFKASKVSGHHIKDIDMQGVYSFFNTDRESAERILAGMPGTQYRNREVRVESADKQSFKGPKSFSKDRKPAAAAPKKKTFGKKRSW